MSRLLRIVLAGWLILIAATGGAHEISIAEMEVREIARGEYLWQWTAAGNRAAGDELAVAWPDGCRAEESALHCGPAGLSGTLAVDGVGKRYSAAVIKVFWLDGQMRVHTLTPAQPTVHLFGAADDKRGIAQIASTYTALGIEHILGGFDHLMFVIGLLFLVGFNRRLVLTITAFTAAHSLTLASSALGLLTLRPPPVEATIALSIMLVAGEALHQRPTLARRWPAVVAFLFGLVHGLGFAGALKDIGLPESFAWMALLTFNVGVEIGQLMTVALAWVLYRATRQIPAAQQARRAILYAIGSMAAYWSLARIATLFF
jgi:hydrogenase/urease accessory protein HupE